MPIQNKNSFRDNKCLVSTDIVSLSKKKTLSYKSHFISADKKGLTVRSNKKDFFIPEREFSQFLNHPVELFLSLYELPFYGVILKINPIKKSFFEIRIGFMESTPLFYRECLNDLLN